MATADEVGECPECGSIDRGARYLMPPPSEGNPLGTFCKNAWHHETQDFTEQEFQVIFALCRGLRRNEEIAQQCGIAEQTVMTVMASVFDKGGVSSRMDLLVFVRDALNAELRRRRLSPGDSGAAMEG